MGHHFAPRADYSPASRASASLSTAHPLCREFCAEDAGEDLSKLTAFGNQMKNL
jgi:hypothetical protein